MKRRKSDIVKVGSVCIGGDERITVQSMLNTKTADTLSSCEQIKGLISRGCDIIRFAVPDMKSAEAITVYKNEFPNTPFVADIHFDYKIALRCIELGIDKIRINPGNIGGEERVKAVADAARAMRIPIRIGVNGGSLEKHILAKYGAPTSEALAESAFYHVGLLEKFGFYDTIIAVKASDVVTMVEANRIIADKCRYPLHLGVTEAGTKRLGVIKSAAGIGSLLLDGIGDTIRISLTDSPYEEVAAAHDLLEALGLSRPPVTVMSCPTCGRTQIDIIGLANAFDEVRPMLTPSRPVKVAIMGCVVNGPGEAKECDIGIAGGVGEAMLFAHGKIICKVPESDIIQTLVREINKL